MNVRPNADILDAYHNNRDISRDECRLLYTLVDDPWDLGSEINYAAYVDFLVYCDPYIDWNAIDWIVDYGSGVGTFTKAVKACYPHIKSIGIDFDTARHAAEKRFGARLFDYYYAMDVDTNEYDLLRERLPKLDSERLCTCFFNSVNYLFRDQKKKSREKKLLKLVKRLEKLSTGRSYKYLVANSNFFYPPIDKVMQKHGCELVHHSNDYMLDSRVDRFKAVLHTRIWQK
ncbi:hypothetical protein T5B8_08889 [Salinisphaera sp. T5B8]